MQVQVLGAERRRRWSYDEKVRLIEETLQVGETVCSVARRHGLAQSLLFSLASAGARRPPWRRGRTGSCSCRDHFYTGDGMRTAAAVFAPCAARKGRNNRDRTWRLSRAC